MQVVEIGDGIGQAGSKGEARELAVHGEIAAGVKNQARRGAEGPRLH